MFPELRKRVKKVGKPPGTPLYTGDPQTSSSHITIVTYTAHDFHETTGTSLEECLPAKKESGMRWVNVVGLHNPKLIDEIAKYFDLHPLTVEDIVNVEQRPKVEEFEGYLFITLKMLLWPPNSTNFSAEQLSLVMGKNFVLSFEEHETPIFDIIYQRLRSGSNQRLRQHGSDYLAYRLMDIVVDQYYVVLEKIGEQIEEVEELIISNPTPENARMLYQIKRQMLILRKAIWPMREVISHLLQVEKVLITSFTRVYLRDVYDHTAQAIDTVESFRDMLAGMLDVYLSSLTNRMNEIMKTLTIIATIFIPLTSIASIYGMNFEYMPELKWHWGYPVVLAGMLLMVIVMLVYFRRKKWI